jgi:hypothetical protein
VFPSHWAPSSDHGGTDTRTERHHHNVVAVCGRASVVFAEKGEAGVVFENRWQAEFSLRPGGQIEISSVGVLMVRGDDPAGRTVDKPAKAKPDPLEAMTVLDVELVQSLGNYRQEASQASGTVRF